MLQKLTGYCNSIKKTQAEIQVALSDMKENLQGTKNGGDEAENHINNLERKEEKKHSIRTAGRKKN